MKKQTNTPKLRFPNFKGEWETKKLGEIAEIKSGATPLRSNKLFFDGGTIAWVKTTDLNNSDIYKTEEYVTEYAIKNTSLKINPINSVLVAMYGGFNQIGRTGILKIPAATNQALSVLNTNEKIVVPQYLIIWLNAKIDLWKQFAGSSRKDPNITGSDVNAFPISFPTLAEQQKIASFLSLVDKKLAQLHQKKQLLQAYKKGVMQKIFSQTLRFKDKNGKEFGEWEMKKLGEVAKFYSGGTPLTTKREYYNGNIPFIKSGEINSDVTEQFISEEALKNSSAKLVNKGDILYALYGATSGEVAISKIDGAINQAVLCIKSNENHFYIYSILKFQKESIIKTFLQGGQGNLSAEIVKNLQISVPSLAEQTKIANFLSAIDAKIELCSQEIALTENYKKGLLQQMFV